MKNKSILTILSLVMFMGLSSVFASQSQQKKTDIALIGEGIQKNTPDACRTLMREAELTLLNSNDQVNIGDCDKVSLLERYYALDSKLNFEDLSLADRLAYIYTDTSAKMENRRKEFLAISSLFAKEILRNPSYKIAIEIVKQLDALKEFDRKDKKTKNICPLIQSYLGVPDQKAVLEELIRVVFNYYHEGVMRGVIPVAGYWRDAATIAARALDNSYLNPLGSNCFRSESGFIQELKSAIQKRKTDNTPRQSIMLDGAQLWHFGSTAQNHNCGYASLFCPTLAHGGEKHDLSILPIDRTPLGFFMNIIRGAVGWDLRATEFFLRKLYNPNYNDDQRQVLEINGATTFKTLMAELKVDGKAFEDRDQKVAQAIQHHLPLNQDVVLEARISAKVQILDVWYNETAKAFQGLWLTIPPAEHVKLLERLKMNMLQSLKDGQDFAELTFAGGCNGQPTHVLAPGYHRFDMVDLFAHLVGARIIPFINSPENYGDDNQAIAFSEIKALRAVKGPGYSLRQIDDISGAGSFFTRPVYLVNLWGGHYEKLVPNTEYYAMFLAYRHLTLKDPVDLFQQGLGGKKPGGKKRPHQSDSLVDSYPMGGFWEDALASSVFGQGLPSNGSSSNSSSSNGSSSSDISDPWGF